MVIKNKLKITMFAPVVLFMLSLLAVVITGKAYIEPLTFCMLCWYALQIAELRKRGKHKTVDLNALVVVGLLPAGAIWALSELESKMLLLFFISTFALAMTAALSNWISTKRLEATLSLISLFWVLLLGIVVPTIPEMDISWNMHKVFEPGRADYSAAAYLVLFLVSAFFLCKNKIDVVNKWLSWSIIIWYAAKLILFLCRMDGFLHISGLTDMVIVLLGIAIILCNLPMERAVSDCAEFMLDFDEGDAYGEE